MCYTVICDVSVTYVYAAGYVYGTIRSVGHSDKDLPVRLKWWGNEIITPVIVDICDTHTISLSLSFYTYEYMCLCVCSDFDVKTE